MLPTRNPSQNKRPTQTEGEGLEKNIPSKQGKKARVAILISDIRDFKKQGHKKRHRRTLHKLKGRIHQEDINIVNIYASNIGAPKYIRKILEDFKKDIDSSVLTARDSNTPLSTMHRSCKQNTNKDIVELNDTTDQMNLIDIYKNFYLNEAKYTFFSNAHAAF